MSKQIKLYELDKGAPHGQEWKLLLPEWSTILGIQDFYGRPQLIVLQGDEKNTKLTFIRLFRNGPALPLESMKYIGTIDCACHFFEQVVPTVCAGNTMDTDQ